MKRTQLKKNTVPQNKYNRPRPAQPDKVKLQELQKILEKKKMFVIQTILLKHYGIEPTNEVLHTRVVREVLQDPKCKLPERFFLLPEEPSYRHTDRKKIAAFVVNLIHDSAIEGDFKYRADIQFDTPNNELIDLSDENQVLKDFEKPEEAQVLPEVKCPECGWSGEEKDLPEVDAIFQNNSLTAPVCPDCGNNELEILK